MYKPLGTVVLALTSFMAGAQALSEKEQLQMTQCLASKLTIKHTVLAENKEFKIIEVPANTLNAIRQTADHARCGGFVNVTDRLTQTPGTRALQAKQLLQKPLMKRVQNQDASYQIKHMKEVNEALGTIDSKYIWQTLTHLTNYQNRSATKDTGVEAAQWLKATVDAMALAQGRSDVETRFVATGSRYKQPSLVTVLGKDIAAPAVVIGAHMDTLDGRMPGAGDDGSGSAVVMEMMRVLLADKHPLQRPIYVMWYAAEERGLVGSQYVVQDFLKKHIPVYAVIQFDMTGYRNNPADNSMWVFRDYTDKQLNQFVADLIKQYIKVPVKYSECGYGCSDHASWMEEGIPAAFPCETSFDDHNPYIHTSADNLSLMNEEHLTNFAKLAVSFALELGLG